MGYDFSKHADKLRHTLSCFDPVLFRGYLVLLSAYAMACFRETWGYGRDVKGFGLTQAYRFKDHASNMVVCKRVSEG